MYNFLTHFCNLLIKLLLLTYLELSCAVMVSSNSKRGMFLLNMLDPDAVKLKGQLQVTCKVGQVQQ